MNSPSAATRVAVNTLANYARFAVSTLVWVLLTPRMVHGFGEQDYGLWSLVYSVVGFFSLLDLGMGTGVVKCVAESGGTGDVDRRNRMVSTYAAAYAGVALAAAAILGILSLAFNRLFSIPAEAHGRALATLWIIGLRAVVLAFPLSLFRGILYGQQSLLLLNLLQAASTVAYGIGAAVALAGGHGVVAVAVVSLLSMLLEHGLYAAFAWRRTPGLRIAPALVDPRLLREAASLSVSQLLIAVSGLALLRTDPVVIQLFLGLSAVGVYTIALKAAENGFVLVKQFVNALSPLVAHLHGARRADRVQEVLVAGTRLALVPAALLAAGVAALGGRALVLWVGPEFAAGTWPMILLVVSMTLTVPQMMVFSVLTYTDRHGLPAKASIAAAALNVVLTLALVKPLGLVGVALGTLGATLVVDVVWVLGRGCREIGVPHATYVREALLPPLWPALAQWAVTAALTAARPPATLVELVAYGVPGAVLYLAIFRATGLGRFEREWMAARLRRRAPLPVAAKAAA